MPVAKKLVNKVENVIDEMIQGMLVTHPGLRRLDGYDVLVRADFQSVKETQVALISGGGSGHEPAHAGFIGDGMLTAAVCGGVFASPSLDSILATIVAVTGHMGCLLIVKNYTGDRLNFGLAAEMAKSKGLKVFIVFVADDYALKQEKGVTGRRGLAGTVFVHKVAGATAKAGYSLEEVVISARAVADRVATVGISLSNCNIPGNEISDRLRPDDNKMEVGLGIHGEAGLETVNLMTAREALETTINVIGEQLEHRLDRVVMLLNNLGGTTAMEMYVLASTLHTFFKEKANPITIERLYVSSMMTSLEMQGFSLTLLPIYKTEGDLVLARLDAFTNAPGWPSEPFRSTVTMPKSVEAPKVGRSFESDPASQNSAKESHMIEAVKLRMEAAAQAVIQAEPKLTEWDTVVGDGDCGETFKQGASQVLAYLDSICSSPARAFDILSQLAMKMGGTSGAVLAIFFRACHRYCHEKGYTSVHFFQTISAKEWKAIVNTGSSAVTEYGGATRGMRTMLDTILGLEEALDKLETKKLGPEELKQLAQSSLIAAEETAHMTASAGRSNYLRDDITRGVPDPGAMALGFALNAMLQ